MHHYRDHQSQQCTKCSHHQEETPRHHPEVDVEETEQEGDGVVDHQQDVAVSDVDGDNEHGISDDDDGDDGDYDFNSFHNSGYIDLASPAKKCLR